nr:DUF1127 domain-containing protein [uncultured Celeribacter sp.]
MATLSQNIGVTGGIAIRLDAYLAKLAHRRAQRAEAKRVYNELSTYTDAELADLGVSRLSIRDIAAEAGRMI